MFLPAESLPRMIGDYEQGKNAMRQFIVFAVFSVSPTVQHLAIAVHAAVTPQVRSTPSLARWSPQASGPEGLALHHVSEKSP